jgi:hypothetical protein
MHVDVGCCCAWHFHSCCFVHHAPPPARPALQLQLQLQLAAGLHSAGRPAGASARSGWRCRRRRTRGWRHGPAFRWHSRAPRAGGTPVAERAATHGAVDRLTHRGRQGAGISRARDHSHCARGCGRLTVDVDGHSTLCCAVLRSVLARLYSRELRVLPRSRTAVF